MFFIFAYITHFFGGGCMAYPYETEETKGKCVVCNKELKDG